jgi:ribonuclease BN (tRNA processing enzyme)
MRTWIACLLMLAGPLLAGCGRGGASAATSESSAEAAPTEAPIEPAPPSPIEDGLRTRVVMLGTGTPINDPERAGPSVAVVVDDTPYIVDFGPGVVRRAAAAELAGVTGLAVDRLSRAFCTHLHSDHTVGYPDLILTPWVLGREVPLQVYGPPGLGSMTDHVLAAWAEDIEVRSEGNQPSEELGWRVEVHEIEPGIVYTDERVKVTAFNVRHGAWTHAYGYRFDTPDRSVVISGDTVAIDTIVEQCDGCDVLVHEVYAKAGFDQREPDWQVYHRASHTSGVELGELAARAEPKLLVLTHQLLWGATEEQLLEEVRQNFDGEVVYANDLDVY